MNLQIELLKEEGMIFNYKYNSDKASNYMSYIKPWSMLQPATELLTLSSGEKIYEDINFYDVIKADELANNYVELLAKLLEEFTLALKALFNRIYCSLEFSEMEKIDDFIYNYPFTTNDSFSLSNKEIVLPDTFLNFVNLEDFIFIFNNCVFEYQDIIKNPLNRDFIIFISNKNINEHNINTIINIISLTNDMLKVNPILEDKGNVFINNLDYEIECCIELIIENRNFSEEVSTYFDLLSIVLNKLKVVDNDEV